LRDTGRGDKGPDPLLERGSVVAEPMHQDIVIFIENAGKESLSLLK